MKRQKKQFEKSEKNTIQSVSVFYSKGMVGKEKYKSQSLTYELKAPGAKRLAKRLRLGKKINIPSLLSYQKLLIFMNSIDIGSIKDVNLDFCDNLINDDDKVEGKYKELGEVLLNLAENRYSKIELV